jgi:hypothetical protein
MALGLAMPWPAMSGAVRWLKEAVFVANFCARCHAHAADETRRIQHATGRAHDFLADAIPRVDCDGEAGVGVCHDMSLNYG